ncbi:MAG: SDR family oxidoreductase [Paludibacteraceae bacterium]|nr:SDR family oxidoreductase [Paludibacteraceae bacterium]
MHKIYILVRKIWHDFFYKPIKQVTTLRLTPIQYGQTLKGKKILITGGSDGIGYAIAKKFVSEGADVMITGRNEDRLKLALSRLKSIHICQWDISDIDILDTKLDECISELGGLDVLINNAAFFERGKHSDRDFYEKTMRTNAESVYLICQKVVMIYQKINMDKGGKIINISSMNAIQSSTSPYAISKATVDAITRGFAIEYADKNIQVNAIAPGYCNSSINKLDDKNNYFSDLTRINRIILPEEIAEIAMFLSTDAANGIIGQTILCDGGATLQQA